MSEEVVLLPLVPVTHRTRAQVRLCEPQAQAAHHRDALPRLGRATSGRYRDSPGVFTTTSQRLQGGQAAVGGGEHRAPGSAGPAGRPVVDEDRLGAQRQQLAQVGVAFPAQPPDPDPLFRPGRTRRAWAAGRSWVRAHRYRSGMKFRPTGSQHGGGLRLRRRVRPAGHLGREFLQQAGVRSVVAPRGQQDRGPALGDLADALERLGARAEQRPELGRAARGRPAAPPPRRRSAAALQPAGTARGSGR